MVLEPTARLQVGNYIIKEWGRSATPDGKTYNVPVITIEDAALTWRVSVESSHSRYMFFQTFLHWGEVMEGSPEPTENALHLLESVCLITFFMTTEDFMLSSSVDEKFLKDVAKAMKGHADRMAKEAPKQTDTEREKADAEALADMKEDLKP